MYPVSLDITGKRCVVVGGGSVATRKVHGLLQAGGQVRVISPEAGEDIKSLAVKRQIEWMQKPFAAADVEGAFLVFAATDNPAVQAQVVQAAHVCGVLVNVADGPGQCDFQVPAVVRRGALAISITTEGTTPAVAAMVRRQLESRIGEEYGLLTRLVGLVRDEILAQAGSESAKKILFQKLLQDDILLWLREGQWDRVRERLESVTGQPFTPDLAELFKEKP